MRSFPNEWFIRQRMWPAGSFQPAAFQQGLIETLQKRGRHTEGAAEWKLVGPSNIGGRVTDVQGSLVDPNLVVIGTAAGGVWMSEDKGQHFAPIFENLSALSIGAVALDPRDANTIWVGTGEANPSGHTYPGLGIFVSNDRGKTFRATGLQDAGQISRIVIDPQNSANMYVAVLGQIYQPNETRGIFHSADGGKTWQRVLFLNNSTGAIDLAMSSQSSSTLYAAFWDMHRSPTEFVKGGTNSSIYKTTDGGQNWTKLTNGLPAPSAKLGRIGLALSASDPNVLYATYDNVDVGFGGIYRSTDAGQSFSLTRGSNSLGDIYSTYGWWFGNVRVHPRDPKRVYVLGLGSAVSSDGGDSFDSWEEDFHPDNHTLFINPEHPELIFEGNDGGLMVSVDGGSNFTKPELPISQFYAMAADPSDPSGNKVYGGLQDNGTVGTSDGGLSDWKAIYGGDGFQVQIQPNNPDVIYAEAQYGDLGVSTDGGSYFSSIAPGFARANWNTPILIDPSNPVALLVGGERLFESSNRGSGWTAISPDLTGGSPQGRPEGRMDRRRARLFPQDILIQGTISTFDVCAADSKVIYVGTDTGLVWVTRDHGAHWQQINQGLPQRWITRIKVRSSNPAEVFVTLSGFQWGQNIPHIFHSTNFGQTWESISGDLPQVPVNTVLLHPTQTQTLVVGTDTGVFDTHDGGAHWEVLGDGLPMVPVMDLVYHARSNTIFAATHGRGIYRLGH